MIEPYRVLICGDRNYTNRKKIWRLVELLRKQHKKLIIIHGGADGADTIAGECAQAQGIHTAVVDALWEVLKPYYSAGPRRNTAMSWLEPHHVYAFHEAIEKSKGTKNMVEQARKAGIPVRIYT